MGQVDDTAEPILPLLSRKKTHTAFPSAVLPGISAGAAWLSIIWVNGWDTAFSSWEYQPVNVIRLWADMLYISAVQFKTYLCTSFVSAST